MNRAAAMRQYALLLLMVPATLAAQSTTKVYGTDINGNRILVGERSAGEGSKTEKIETLNGRRVPVETVDEKVIEKSGGRTVIERTITRRSLDGSPLPPEKIRVEESKDESGHTTTSTTVWRGDINGRMAVTEREITESDKSGDRVQTDTRIERPGVNGSLVLSERRTAVESGNKTANQREEVIYSPNTNGQFVATGKETSRTYLRDGVPVTESAQYESASSGSMQLSRQTVTETRKTASGDQELTTVYDAAAPGRSADGQPKLREQRVIDRIRTGDEITETLSIRRASPNDSKQLGPPQRISETVCKGKCN